MHKDLNEFIDEAQKRTEETLPLEESNDDEVSLSGCVDLGDFNEGDAITEESNESPQEQESDITSFVTQGIIVSEEWEKDERKKVEQKENKSSFMRRFLERFLELPGYPSLLDDDKEI